MTRGLFAPLPPIWFFWPKFPIWKNKNSNNEVMISIDIHAFNKVISFHGY